MLSSLQGERERGRERERELAVKTEGEREAKSRSTDPNLEAERSIHDLKFSLNWTSIAENLCLH